MRGREEVREQAMREGRVWVHHPYYDDAENWMEHNWEGCIWRNIKDCDFSCVVDLAAGRGRNTVKLLPLAEKIWVVDINEENIAYCRERFAGESKVSFFRNDGISLPEIPDESVSLVYCFDAMVHFDSDVLRAYLAEFRRILRAGGQGFCHHSNYTKNPTGYFGDNPGWRNFMSESLFAHYCAKEGLEVEWSQVIRWVEEDSDCLTRFRKA